MESQLRGEFEGNHSTFLVRDPQHGVLVRDEGGIAFIAPLALVSLRCLPCAVCASDIPQAGKRTAHMHGCTRACTCPSLVLAFSALQVPASDAGLGMNSTPLHVKSGEADGSAVDATLAGLPLDLSGIF